MTSLVAVLDIGKTNTKLMLVEAPSGRTVWSAERASAAILSRNAPVLKTELDIFGIENWLLAQLRDLPERGRVSAILPIAHGAALVLVDGEGEVLAAPDYEDTSFDRLRGEYTRLRDPFAQTLSPALPAGLNLGTQLYHLQNEASALFLRARYVLTYPQYWSWRLSGVTASEVIGISEVFVTTERIHIKRLSVKFTFTYCRAPVQWRGGSARANHRRCCPSHRNGFLQSRLGWTLPG